MNIQIELLDLLKAGVHYGHQKSRWHPKMKPYIFGIKSGIHIIDLEKTKQALEGAQPIIENIIANQGTILFLSTKRQSQKFVEECAIKCGMPYIHRRYIGGFITNFFEIRKLIRKYRTLLLKREKGELKKYTKKEQLEFDRDIERLHDAVGGVVNMEQLPELIFMIDIKHEKTALKEAIRKHIPIMAICDTNVNPENIDYVIPGNDDATKAIELYCKYICDFILEAKEKFPVKETIQTFTSIKKEVN